MKSEYDDGPSVWKVIGVGALVLVVAVGISVGVWAFRVATADVKGRGDTVIKNDEVNNRTRAQEKFYTMYRGIEAADANIDVAAATARAHPNDRIAGVNLDGAIMNCQNQVFAYNAETGKILSRDWRDPELPYEITVGGGNPKTDCRENIK